MNIEVEGEYAQEWRIGEGWKRTLWGGFKSEVGKLSKTLSKS